MVTGSEKNDARAIYIQGAKFWNELPLEPRKLEIHGTFRKAVKARICHNQYNIKDYVPSYLVIF